MKINTSEKIKTRETKARDGEQRTRKQGRG